ncbi:hypothetical protein K1719_010742 [Acacia pycnantha]|nr:hypothetical protein K1719_010742 [Acacia pycnantha]
MKEVEFNRLRGGGHGIVASRGDAKLNVAAWMSKNMGGLRYCSSHENLTIDHVVPASLGGEWKWENLAQFEIDRACGQAGHEHDTTLRQLDVDPES